MGAACCATSILSARDGQNNSTPPDGVYLQEDWSLDLHKDKEGAAASDSLHLPVLQPAVIPGPLEERVQTTDLPPLATHAVRTTWNEHRDGVSDASGKSGTARGPGHNSDPDLPQEQGMRLDSDRQRLQRKSDKVRKKIMANVSRATVSVTISDLEVFTRFSFQVIGELASSVISAACSSREALENRGRLFHDAESSARQEWLSSAMDTIEADNLQSDMGSLDDLTPVDSEGIPPGELGFEAVVAYGSTGSDDVGYSSQASSCTDRVSLSQRRQGGLVGGTHSSMSMSQSLGTPLMWCLSPIPYPWGRTSTQDKVRLARLVLEAKSSVEDALATSLPENSIGMAMVFCLIVDPTDGGPDLGRQLDRLNSSLKAAGTALTQCCRVALLLRCGTVSSKRPRRSQNDSEVPSQDEEPWIGVWENFVRKHDDLLKFGPISVLDGDGLFAAFAKIASQRLFETRGTTLNTNRLPQRESYISQTLYASSAKSSLPQYAAERGGSMSTSTYRQ